MIWNQETMKKARCWVSWFSLSDSEVENEKDLKDSEIQAVINDHYAGGEAEFLKDVRRDVV